MESEPRIKFNLNNSTMNISRFPFWNGVHNDPIQRIEKDLTIGYGTHGVIQQIERNSKLDIVDIYSQKKYQMITQPPGKSDWANSILQKSILFFSKYIDFSKIKCVLEIGAGSFHLANYLIGSYRNIKHYVVVDPSIREAPLDSRIEFRNEYFNSADEFSINPDLIISISCLEHLPDPFLFLSEIKRLLEPNSGVAFISFPEVEHQFRNGDIGSLVHEHISYFTVYSAKNLIQKAGFSIMHSEIMDDTQRHIIKPNHAFFRASADTCRFLTETGPKFEKALMYARSQLRISLEKSQKIGIHGACNATFNALNLANLNDHKIAIFDGDITKKGKYMPSINTPILHSSDPEYEKMDVIYIGAMSFYKEIKKYLIKSLHFPESKIKPLFPRENLAVVNER